MALVVPARAAAPAVRAIVVRAVGPAATVADPVVADLVVPPMVAGLVVPPMVAGLVVPPMVAGLVAKAADPIEASIPTRAHFP